MPNDPLGIRDYLEASTDASKRTRTITIILAIASISAFAALLNSLQSQWMHQRILHLADIHGKYTESKLGPYPRREAFQHEGYFDKEQYDKHIAIYETRYAELNSAVERAYVEGSLVVRVPFFGFTFDVNDLGLLASIAFLVILACYRFFLSREIDNLRLSFEEAAKLGKQELKEFYTLLTMRQVFTVPTTPYIKRSKFLLFAPKLLPWFPFAVHVAVTVHDFLTAFIGKELQSIHFVLLTTWEVGISVVIFWLSLSLTKRLLTMDREWNSWWNEIKPPDGLGKSAAAGS